MEKREIESFPRRLNGLNSTLPRVACAAGRFGDVRLELRLDDRRDDEEAQDREDGDERGERNRGTTEAAGPWRAGRCGVGVHTLPGTWYYRAGSAQ